MEFEFWKLFKRLFFLNVLLKFIIFYCFMKLCKICVFYLIRLKFFIIFDLIFFIIIKIIFF